MSRLFRSIHEPIRRGLSWEECWQGPDRGLIWNWERGRQIRDEDPQLAARAEAGELVTLAWKGGTANLKPPEPDKPATAYGSLQYLAQWQGLRGENLEIELDDGTEIVCAVRQRAVRFRKWSPKVERGTGPNTQ